MNEDRCTCGHSVRIHAWDDDAKWPCTHAGCACAELTMGEDED
jgi:hypothetical protein